MRTISPTATPLPTAYDCVAVYIAGRRTNLVVYGCRPKPTTKNVPIWWRHHAEKAFTCETCEWIAVFKSI